MDIHPNIKLSTNTSTNTYNHISLYLKLCKFMLLSLYISYMNCYFKNDKSIM